MTTQVRNKPAAKARINSIVAFLSVLEIVLAIREVKWRAGFGGEPGPSRSGFRRAGDKA
jgi:hypothetical protein